jgi:F-type H+-transporting ATPase subunit c
MEMEALKYIGVGLTSLAMMGAALGVANIFAALLNGIARNPSAEPKMAKYFIIGAALSEFMGLLAAILGILMLFG